MSHEIETIAWAGEMPWHGLGKEVPSDLTPEQMMQASGTDWTVSKHSLQFENDGMVHSVPGKQVLVRDTDNKVLDVVSNSWNPLQNATAFEFFHEFVMAGNMDMEVAGSLKGGQIVWALARIHDDFKIMQGDEIQSYLLFSNPHKYGCGITVKSTPIRVVCNNTLSMALSGYSSNSLSINHSRPFNSAEVKDVLELTKQKNIAYQEKAVFLASKRFDHETMMEYFTRIWPSGKKEISTNAAQASQTYLHEQAGAEYGEGSWWQVFNTVTYMTNHVLGHKTDTKMNSLWYGANAKRNLDALDLAVEYAEAA